MCGGGGGPAHDGLAAAVAKGARGEVGAVLEAFGGGEDAVLRRFWDGLRGGGGVKNARDGGGGEAEMVGEVLRLIGEGRRRRFRCCRGGQRGSIFPGHPWSLPWNPKENQVEELSGTWA